jgi:hypothetical protein
MSDREGILIGRIVIEKYATADDVGIWVDTDDGQDGELALIDALGMLTFASGLHISRIDRYDTEDDQ